MFESHCEGVVEQRGWQARAARIAVGARHGKRIEDVAKRLARLGARRRCCQKKWDGRAERVRRRSASRWTGAAESLGAEKRLEGAVRVGDGARRRAGLVELVVGRRRRICCAE